MKKGRAAALIAVIAAAVAKAKSFAQENPDKAGQAIDRVESVVRSKAGPKHADKIAKGSKAIRDGLGLPPEQGGPAVPQGPTDPTGPTDSTGTTPRP